VRLAKFLAHGGVASRRLSERVIEQGRVSLNGEVVTDPARNVAEGDEVRVDGSVVGEEGREVWAVNKPAGVVSTAKEPGSRPAVVSLVESEARLYPVGRLDAESTGLLLLTNDGELAHRLQHPSYGITKTYLAEIRGPVARDVGKRLRAGIELEDGVVSVDSFRIVDSQPGKALVEVIIHEGKHHVVRRLLEAVGHPVLQLVRTEVGPIRLGELRSGKVRSLTRDEVGRLHAAVGL
jgi:23S rRNA pseudouridine2605 synthase